MVFEIPQDLAPEVYALAWIVGKWRGYAHMQYEGIEPSFLLHEMLVEHDGGPYLKMTSTFWQAAQVKEEISQGTPGAVGASLLTKGMQWSTETLYWRPTPGSQIGPAPGKPAGEMEPTTLEVLANDPAGHLVLYAGVVQGPRIQLVSDQIVMSPSAASLQQVTRMYGLIKTELLWVQEMAAFGQDNAPYLSGQLSRVVE